MDKTGTSYELLREIEKKGILLLSIDSISFEVHVCFIQRRLKNRGGHEKCLVPASTAILGLPLSYAIIRHTAIRLNSEHNLVDDFKASKSWIGKFVRECGLRSRKVTRFVTTATLRSKDDVEAAADGFVKRRYIRRIHDHVIHHQSDFAYSRDNILKSIADLKVAQSPLGNGGQFTVKLNVLVLN
ncbi:hypothetical protein COOONC_05016 [Cooperia oncophora]